MALRVTTGNLILCFWLVVATSALANALVSSRLYYCNVLLHSISRVHLNKQERVQNCLARVLTKCTKLIEIYQQQTIAGQASLALADFKIATLSYKVIHLKRCIVLHIQQDALPLCAT